MQYKVTNYLIWCMMNLGFFCIWLAVWKRTKVSSKPLPHSQLDELTWIRINESSPEHKIRIGILTITDVQNYKSMSEGQACTLSKPGLQERTAHKSVPKANRTLDWLRRSMCPADVRGGVIAGTVGFWEQGESALSALPKWVEDG